MAFSERIMMSALCCALLGCGPPPMSMPMGLTSLAKASSGGLRVEMLSASPLVTGKNQVFYRVTNQGALVDSAQLAQRPAQSCPLHDPSVTPNADGLWEGQVFFPSAGEADFGLDVRLKPQDDAQRFDLGVLSVGDSPLAKLMTHDGENVLIAISFPAAPHVGQNPIEVTAHMEHAGMGYMPATDPVFKLITEMPAMGHGSSGSVSPTLSDDGVYRGTAVFSMSGDWVLKLDVSMHGEALGTIELSYPL